jgi:hypothetical protein
MVPRQREQVADSLSWDHHITNSTLLPLLHSSFPKQMPRDFAIFPLPRRLSSQITTWLRMLPPSSQSPKVPTRSEIGTSTTTPPSSNGSSSTTTPSLTTSTPSAAPASSESSPTRIGSEDFPLLQTLIHEHQELVATPSTLWLRPTGLTGAAAPVTTPAESSPSFYWINCRATKTTTHPHANKRLSPRASFGNCAKTMTVRSTEPPTSLPAAHSSLPCNPAST